MQFRDMTHAVIILSHGDFDMLYKLVEYFSADCRVFIHVDAKTPIPEDVRESFLSLKQVAFIGQKYNVHWGGFSILKTEIFMLKKALKDTNADYFHLISGQDYPIRPLSDFLAFFDGKETDFMQYVHLPHPRWNGNTFARFQYFYPYDLCDNKDKGNRWCDKWVEVQKKFGFKRRIPDCFDHLYGNSQWFSICRKSVRYLVDYTTLHPKLFRRMRMTFAPEESYVSTVLVNNPDKQPIVSENLRFILWKYENGNMPANLGIEHFRGLLEWNCFFARKMAPHCSLPLIDAIDRYLLHDASVVVSETGGWFYPGFLKYHFDKSFCDFVCVLWAQASLTSGIDFGCGAGHYVAVWRERGLRFKGYDANPHTPELSKLLTKDGNPLCGVADLTDDLSVNRPFDIVICKDVLNYIPQKLQPKAISNLAMLSARYVLLSWHTDENTGSQIENPIDEMTLVSEFEKCGFVIDNHFTFSIRLALRQKDCCVFCKKEV